MLKASQNKNVLSCHLKAGYTGFSLLLLIGLRHCCFTLQA